MTEPSGHNGEKSPASNADRLAPIAKKTRGYMQVLSLTSVGLEMGIAVVIGLLGGQWLDRRFDTEPLFLILGVLFGCGAAAKAVWAAVKKADRMVDDPIDKPGPTPSTPPADKDVP
jgi:ATP synthase protein I